jgi:hypothetical protein
MDIKNLKRLDGDFKLVKALKYFISRPCIPHSHIGKSEIKESNQRCFAKKNREQRHHYIVIGRDKSYFVKSHS